MYPASHKYHQAKHHKQQQQKLQSSTPPGSALATAGSNAPEFEGEMQNITVALGRDVTFECIVNNLGSYKVSFCSRVQVEMT